MEGQVITAHSHRKRNNDKWIYKPEKGRGAFSAITRVIQEQRERRKEAVIESWECVWVHP